MTKVFHARSYGRFIKNRAISGEKNFIKQIRVPIKVPIFLEAVSAIEIM